MGSLVLDVLRKGIWSSFTGGWYYDPSSATFTNTFHLYLFLFFLCFPFSVYVYLPRSAVNWLIYTSVIGCVFVAIKLINIGLHCMFDTSECIVEEPSSIDIQLECEKRKSNQKTETNREEEGIELQVFGNDKVWEPQHNENNSSFDSVEFADFNSTAVKEDSKASASATIDLKVDVHRKNSSDSSEGTFFRSDKILVVDEANSQESSKEKISSVSNQRVPDVTSSEEVLVSKDLKLKITNKRNLGVKDNASQDVSTAVDVSDTSGGRLSERSRQYSVSVTLGEGTENTNTITDPTPARSMQLNSEYEADSGKSPGEKGLLYWKEKWNKQNPHRSRVKGNSTLPPDIAGPSSPRRSSSPLSIYTSDIVYPIAEHTDEQPISSIKRSSAHSDDDDDDEDYIHHNQRDDDDDYADIDDDLDIEIDSSHSPLLAAKHLPPAENNGSSFNISKLHRKMAKKYKHAPKTKNETENEKIFSNCRSECDEQKANDSMHDESHPAGDSGLNELQGEDDDPIAAIFDWLFCQSSDRGSGENLNSTCPTKETRSTESEKNKKGDHVKSKMKVKKEFEELQSKYPQIVEAVKSQSKFSSTPTLATGLFEKPHSHKRQRSGTCSQLEISLALPSNERKTSLSEAVGGQSTSVDVYTSVEDQKSEQICPRTTESNEASSSGSNNELSSLLPFPCVTPFINSPSSIHLYHGHRTALRYDSRNNRNRHRRQTRRSRSSIREAFPSASSIRANAPHRDPNDFANFLWELSKNIDLDNTSNTHIATSYDDTTEGAVHIFQDENGQWMSYTFDERGSGIAVNLGSTIARRKETPLNSIEEHNKNTSCASLRIDNCTTFVNSSLRQSVLDTPATQTQTATTTAQTIQEQPAHSQLYQIRENDNGTYSFETVDHPALLSIPYSQTFVNGAYSSAYPSLRFNPLARLHMPGPSNSQPELNIEYTLGMPRARFDYLEAIEVVDDEKQKRRYYKFRIYPFSHMKIYFDRLSLDALLDFNETYFETFLSVLLAVMVSLLGAVMLHVGYYHDIPAFIFCFVMATSHYSLLKSVQPDAASPVHGFNKVVAFSRPVYFVMCCSIIIGLNFLLERRISLPAFSVYTVRLNLFYALQWTHDFLCTFILFFPLFFTLGMFPQINTFLMYVFEQIDMHLFGGSAVTSLKAASYCVFRSTLAVLFLFGFAYGGLNEPKSSQHILFSIFISLLIMFAYHLSRCTCDPTPIWNILKKQFWPIDELARETKEIRQKSERKLHKSKQKRKISAAYTKDPKVESVKDKDQLEEINVSHQDAPNKKKSTLEDEKKNSSEDEGENLDDPLPANVQKTVNARLQSDLITSCIAGVLIFSIHRSTIFSALQPELNPIMWGVAFFIGFLLHYIMPQMRKQLPWLCIARPVLRSIEHEQFEAQAPATVTWFEKLYVYLGFVEKNIIYPVMFIGCLTSEAPELARKCGPLGSSLVLTICSLKCLRLSFSHASCQYLILAFTVLFFRLEYTSENFVVDYFLISIVFYKMYDLLLKIQFVLTYIAPWQITWGSAFHAFAQPFSLPHSAMMFAQAALSAFLSSPLYPFLGSAIFLTSYPRPVKFWERDYNTRRVDHSNTKMASHLERNLGADDNNLNSIFYEHLTRSLQRSLCGDLLMGRWGEVSAGDCYILASDSLNCLIHIVELGNGLVTFQMRGLEFRGTYCQQREVEAITDGVEENDGCCCCKPGHLPFMLSLNAAFSQRWLAWEVTTGKYILEGYSISDNSAASMLQVFDFRKMLISYYVKSIIYYAVMSPKLEEWINSPVIREALQPIKDKNFVDLDPVFNMNIDEDYDYRYSGITRNSFCSIYVNWIRYCNSKREKPMPDVNKDSALVTLCFALSLLGRRTLGTASHNTAASVEFFLYGVHTLFKGDFRIASVRDEWVFSDMELLRRVVAPAIRMSLKLHQDHFMAPDEYECSPALFSAIVSHQENLVISHEGDPVWRKAVLSGKPSLLALRRVMDEGSDDYKIIMLNKRFLSFRVIKMNRECVRGLWAGQQQELIFLRNLNPERGSIQNAKQALRNIINSSCDQPIGYPIFVSPLTTSYAETNAQYTHYLGGSVSIKSIKNFVLNFCRRVRKRCVEGCSSGSSAHSQDDGGFGHEGIYSMTTFNVNVHSGTIGSHQSMETSLTGSGGTITRVSAASGVSRPTPSPAGPSKPGLVTLAGLLSPPGNISESIKLTDRKPVEKEEEEKEPILHRVKIIDPGQVHDGINQGRLIDVIWPDEVMRQRGGRNFWKDWVPEAGMEGQVVHRWIPNHPNANKRSTFDRTILLVKIEDKYVPISENGVQDLGAEV